MDSVFLPFCLRVLLGVHLEDANVVKESFCSFSQENRGLCAFNEKSVCKAGKISAVSELNAKFEED